MRPMLMVLFLALGSYSYTQSVKVQPKKYPSLLWEIKGNGLNKPSYLFGTMHVSNKMVFHLSDSFYLALKKADVVALETDPGSWQDDFSKYDMDLQSMYNNKWKNSMHPNDYLTISTLQFFPYDKMIEVALYSSPSIVNSFLYRNNSGASADFEEDTYLDLHIFQAGKKLGKVVCGLENFDESMKLMKEAYADGIKERSNKSRSYDQDEEFSYGKLEDAYRTGNLDLLDTINKLNSTSAAFDEKFIYKRNSIQARSIDSILKTDASVFAGVGAAHLPGNRGVIELLRKMGYHLRPIKIGDWSGSEKDEIEKIHVPVHFTRQYSTDSFFSIAIPGKLYSFNKPQGYISQEQFADMTNGSYYMVTRIHTDAALRGQSSQQVRKKIDSVLYENIPGKIISKKTITKNGYNGIDILNKTRRGDFQRYNVFITPFEVLIFKMSGVEDYVKDSKEADQFFNSIELKQYAQDWKSFSPPFGGFEVNMPCQPIMINDYNPEFMAIDSKTETSFNVIRTDVNNYGFAEEDSFDLKLMEESFSTSDFIDRQLYKKLLIENGYPALEVKYKYKDGSIALVKFLIQGTHYYTIITHGTEESNKMKQFIHSFKIKPFNYPEAITETDTTLHFTVQTSVPLNKKKKIPMFSEEMTDYFAAKDDDPLPNENNLFKHKLISNDLTGEKIYISYFKPSRYYTNKIGPVHSDSLHYKSENQEWTYRSRKKYKLSSHTNVFEYILGDPKSSRVLKGKIFIKNGVELKLETEGDTLSQNSSFISTFFETFIPSDSLFNFKKEIKKSSLFFSDLFGRDSLLHRHALKNVDNVEFDSSDLSQLEASIATLNWKEKNYLPAKIAFIREIGNIRTRQASDYLKQIYFATEDTIEFQYAVLESLLKQKNKYAYEIFSFILTDDPPVLKSGNGYDMGRRKRFADLSNYRLLHYNSLTDNSNDHSFLEGLTDSLELTASIYKKLLPLVTIHDYEEPLIELSATLLDSNLISGDDYKNYESKIIIESKQLIKKQIAYEKDRTIKNALKDDAYSEDEADDYKGSGNNEMGTYATLLMPFYDKNPAVSPLIHQLLNSRDKDLKYKALILLLKNKKPVPDTLINYFARLDEYRYQLYTDLSLMDLQKLFPEKYNNQLDLAKSKLVTVSNESSMDSIVYLDRLPIHFKNKSGYVYFFKCKRKKEENTWKLASVGILPFDLKKFEADIKNNIENEGDYDFTDKPETKLNNSEPIKMQLEKALKKIEYSKRKSASMFYNDENFGNFDLQRNMGLKE